MRNIREQVLLKTSTVKESHWKVQSVSWKPAFEIKPKTHINPIYIQFSAQKINKLRLQRSLDLSGCMSCIIR